MRKGQEWDYDKMDVMTTKGMWLRPKGMWLLLKERDYDKRDVITTKGMWLRQRVCKYDQRDVITTKGMGYALFYIFFTLNRKQLAHVVLLFCA